MTDDGRCRRRRRLRKALLRERGHLPVELTAGSDTLLVDVDGAPVRTSIPVPARRRLRPELSRGR